MSNKRDELIEWTGKMLAEGIITEDNYCLSLRDGDHMLITPAGVGASQLKAEDLVEITTAVPSFGQGNPAQEYPLHAELYRARKDLNAIIHSYTRSTLTASKAGKTLKPLLDDFAQIVGTSTKVAAGHDPKLAGKAVRAMKGRNAVLLKDSGAICASVNMDDAHAVAQVLEKNAKAVIETAFLGGGIKINCFEAALMRFVYKLKYSKAAVENK